MPTLAEYRKTPHWSTSSLSAFLNCSLQWFFRYVQCLEPERSPAAPLLGRAFHKAATWVAAHRRDGRQYSFRDAQDFFSEAFLAECRNAGEVDFRDGDSPGTMDSQGRSLVACLCESWPEEQVLETAVAFCVPPVSYGGVRLSEKVLVGEYDLIVGGGPGRTVIVDWKSAARKWPADKAGKELQATIYLYAYTSEKQVRLDNVGFRFDVVTKTKAPSYTQYPTVRKYDDFARMLWLLQAVDRAVKAGTYLPNEGSFSCGDCAYANACGEWHRRQSKVVSLARAA